MADKPDDNSKKKKKSIIASLDLKNYKAKYTDSYGLGKPNEVDLDNFLIAEPKHDDDLNKQHEQSKQQQNIQPLEQAKNPPKQEKISLSESITADNDFDKRVNAEADNDFYDEKPVQKTAGTFHSNIIKKISPENKNSTEIKSAALQNDNSANINSTNITTATPKKDNSIKAQTDTPRKERKSNRKLNLRDPITVNVRHEVKNRNAEEEPIEGVEVKEPPRRTETYGIVISAVAFIYSIIAKDKPLVFLSVSLLLYLARPILAAPFGKYNMSVQNAIKGFSMALFFGAIFFIFF